MSSMRGVLSVAFALAAASGLTAVSAAEQTKKPATAAKKPAPAVPPTKVAPAITCPAPLGVGVKTKISFCEILAGRDPQAGVIVKLPSRKGPATLTFDLHNLQLYSEEQVKAKRAYAKYTATIGILTMDNTLVTRAVVQSEFRSAADLVDRVGGGAGPGGVKAVAPTGLESIVVTIPDSEEQVSLLGEKLVVEGMTGGPATFTQTGRPIAVISNVMLEYRPAPPPKAPATPRKTK
jgi:hypothetical protein